MHLRVGGLFLAGELFVKELFWMVQQQKEQFVRMAAQFQQEGEGW